MPFDPDKFLSGGTATVTPEAPKAFDPDAFLAGPIYASPPGSIDDHMYWSEKFNGVDYAKNRMSYEDKAGFAQLAKVTDNSADSQKQAINMAYVSKLLPDIPLGVLQKNWPAARKAFASSALQLNDEELNDAKLYEAINERVNELLQSHWVEADSSDRLRMTVGHYEQHRFLGERLPAHVEPLLGSEAAGTKGIFIIPKMEGTGVFPGLINGINRFSAALSTPENITLMAVTGGLGELATGAKTAVTAAEAAGDAAKAIQAAKVALVTKTAQAAVVGTFTAQGVMTTKEAYNRAKLVWNDPNSTSAARSEALTFLVLNAAMTAATAKGTYDIGMEAKTDFSERPKPAAAEGQPQQTKQVPTPEKAQAQEAQKVQTAELLRDEANKQPAGEVKEVLTDAAHQIHPHAQNGAQITEIDGGFVVTDAIGNHIDTVKTIEEAHQAVEKANAARSPEKAPESPETGKTAGIAHRVSEAQGMAAPRGETINIEDTLNEGRKTYTPEKAEAAVAAFEDDPAKGVSRETLVQARLHDEALTKAADEAAEKFGDNSPEHQSAERALEDWKARIKPIQTEWHRHGMLQQGETEIDTGTFRGMTRAVRESTKDEANPEGKEVTEAQKEKIKQHVASVREETAGEDKATKAVAKAMREAAEEEPPKAEKTAKTEPPRKPRTLTRKAAEARARIKAFQERQTAPLGKQGGAVINPAEVAALFRDHAIIGAEYISKGVTEFGEWSKEMVKEFGDYVKPHLQDLFERSKKAVKASQAEDVILDHKAGDKWIPQQAKALWKRAADLIDQGVSYDDMRHQLAKDYGLPVKDITEGIASKKSVREVTDEMYRKMDARRKAQNAAKAWVMEQKYPGYQKIFHAVHQGVFDLYTALHGTAWFTTHAAINLFVPKVTGPMILDLGRAFRMMGDKAYHERIMQDMVRDPLFIKAKRAGLANDPFQNTDAFQNSGTVKIFREIGLIGNRGFDGLKLLRQFRFNQEWATTPPELRTDLMAKIYSEGINKATGHSDLKGFPKGVKGIFFAPGLEASKWAMQFTDPAKDSATLARSLYDKENMSPEEVKGAQQRVKFAVQAVGTYLGLLTLNQAILSATGSDQEINFTDPLRGDWLYFKGSGMKGTPLAGFLRPMTYLMRLTHDFWGERSKYEQMEGSRAGQAAKDTGEYLRSKLHPAYGLAADAVTGSDFQGNTMPWNDDKIPKFEQRGGAHQYTAAEYAATHLAPIPWAEAAKELWTEQGIGEAQQKEWMAALRQAFMAATTATRVSEDKTAHKDSTQPEWMKKLLPTRNIDTTNR